MAASHAEFPFDSKNTPAQKHLCLGPEVAAALQAAAVSLDVTASTLVTWAWGQAIGTAAGADAVAVGQVRSGPPMPDQAGFSMNTVPLVIRRERSGTIRPILQEFRQQLLAMRSIESVAVEQVSANIFKEVGGPWPGGILMVERGTLHHQIGKSERIQSITLHELSGEPLLASAWIHPEMRLEVEVIGTTLGARAAQSLLDHWASIVTAFANGIFTDAAELTALPVNCRDTITSWESGGEAAPPRHLATAWREAAETHSAQCAIWAPDSAITYAELAAQVEHLAAGLQEAGVASGHHVASRLLIRKNLSIALLALARLGAINIPLDTALPEKRLHAIMEDAKPSLILCDSLAASEGFELPCFIVDGAVGKTCTAKLPNDSNAPLSILYTSGSTGKPKGVVMIHGGVINEVHQIARLAGIGVGARVLQFASPGFDASLEEILATLLNGTTLVPRPEELATDLDRFQTFIREADITVLDLSSAHWATWCTWLVAENESVPQNVKTTIIGGERLSARSLQDWFASGGRKQLLVNTYGPTEASIVATAELIDSDWDGTGDPAIGRPLPGVLARIGDSFCRQLPHGAVGELWLGGPCLSPGYWNQPELTAKAFCEIEGGRWYRTGDRACRDDTGKIHFLGRRDDQLKIRGTRIEPTEVIQILEAFPGVSSAFVGVVNNRDGGTLLAAWIRWNVTPRDGWPCMLAAHTATQLPAAAVPARWANVTDFKLTERGKLDRNQLPEPTLTASSHAYSERPATPTESRLATIWMELLDLKLIGRDESFFELGGHSLTASQLFANISREWKIRIPMAVLIQAPTLRMLGTAIDRECKDLNSIPPPESIVIPIRAEGHLPPLFCIHGGDGGVFFYRDLANHLPLGRPLLAIESPALAVEGSVEMVSVEEIAKTYLTAIRHHQKSGPFYLTGYSFGGLIVFEIARQLISEGESVGFLGIVDTMNPAASIRSYSLVERVKIFWISKNDLSLPEKIAALGRRIRDGSIVHVRTKKEIRSATQAGITEPHSQLRILQVRMAHWDSMEVYQPGNLDLKITLFKSRETDDKFCLPNDYGWSGLVRSLDIVEVGGEHLEMFAKQHVQELASEISARLVEPPETGF